MKRCRQNFHRVSLDGNYGLAQGLSEVLVAIESNQNF